MIISRTPLRLSFVGGGTDLPDFADVHGGAVVSTTVDKWIHVIVAARFEGDIRVGYSQTEIVDTANQLRHELVREALRLTGLPRGIDVLTLADVPSHGTGLGSSSALTVGVLNALYAYQGVYKSPYELAEEACEIEIEILGKPIGRQDQYAAAVGGLNLIEFLPGGGGVRIEPIVCRSETVGRLHRSMLTFFTGRQRSADDVLSRQRRAVEEGAAVAGLQEMRDLAYRFRDALVAGEVDELGLLLHRNWELKRSLVAGISTGEMDELYERARREGASGGKILGAGAGGFLLVVAPPDRHAAIRRALNDLREVPLHFTGRGTQITYLDERS